MMVFGQVDSSMDVILMLGCLWRSFGERDASNGGLRVGL